MSERATRTPETCSHSSREHLLGDFGRGPPVAERCNDCGAQWDIQPDGSLLPVKINAVSGDVTPDMDRLAREGSEMVERVATDTCQCEAREPPIPDGYICGDPACYRTKRVEAANREIIKIIA